MLELNISRSITALLTGTGEDQVDVDEGVMQQIDERQQDKHAERTESESNVDEQQIIHLTETVDPGQLRRLAAQQSDHRTDEFHQFGQDVQIAHINGHLKKDRFERTEEEQD
jgi:hypothetical protein